MRGKPAAAGFITGVVLPVDGGWSADKSYNYDPDSLYHAAANSTAI